MMETDVVSEQPRFNGERLVVVLHELRKIEDHISNIRWNARICQCLLEIAYEVLLKSNQMTGFKPRLSSYLVAFIQLGPARNESDVEQLLGERRIYCR